MKKIRGLDLFCGGGGATEGYRRGLLRRGYDVTMVGVDAAWQPNYPGIFLKGDAIYTLLKYGAASFDFVHASPPCQKWTHGNAANNTDHYTDYVELVRGLLDGIGKPYIIENVPRAPLHNPVTLCGTMFDHTAIDDDGTKLYLQRHRRFETNFDVPQPADTHPRGVQWAGAYGGARRDKWEARYERRGGYVPPNLAVLRDLMGIQWMTEAELFQAIPPTYTEYLCEYIPLAA